LEEFQPLQPGWTAGTSSFHYEWKGFDLGEPIIKAAERWRRPLLILMLLSAIMLATHQITLPDASVATAGLQPFSPTGYQRLLVLAPHCDDETLGSAGLILAAQRAGIQVQVVIATNGDGFLFATMQDFHKIYPTHADFVHFGEVRQQESLKALSILGVKPDQVSFLSYPDRGTPDLWNNNWQKSEPFRSPYSGDTSSPYPITYDPNSVYAGEDYLADLTSILESYQPDLVIYPSPQDVHPDHWGLNVFTRMALSLIRHDNPNFDPTELTYLVHRPDFPEIKGLKPDLSLTPPAAIYSLSPDWVRLDLTAEDVALKGQAVQAYQSQLPLLHSLMDSFVRTNELFTRVENATMATLATGEINNPSSWLDPSGQNLAPIQLDPVADYTTRQMIPAGDLTALFVTRDPQNTLEACMQVREHTAPEILYILRMKALTSLGNFAVQARSGENQAGWRPLVRSGPCTCLTIRLAELRNPWAVFIGATTEAGGRIEDETAWQMVYIPGN
jgi:LmbE family N-acetylglucosaminyl deacetylase